MADTKITALAAITTVDPAADVLPIVDISDTSMAASGTTKKITSNQILGAGGTATLASATITGDLTVDTSTLKVDSANDRVGIGTTTPNKTLEVFTATSDTRVRINSTSVVATEYFRSGVGLWLVGSDSTNAFKIARGSNFGGSADYFAIASADAAATWYDAAGGTRMTLNSTGLGVGVVPAGTGGCLQLKSGITFPATQVASSDVNTLDDYEEGNWTPTITAGSGTPTTTSINTSKYTKIGRLVTLEVDISIIAIGTASGVLNFTVPTGFNQSTDGNVGALREVGSTASMGQIFYTAPTTVGMAIYNNATVWVNGYRVRGTYTYTV